MTRTLPPLEAYELWAAGWESEPSPIVALESVWMSRWLPDVRESIAVDAACGTGRWLAVLRELGAHAIGFDLSPAMLARAASRPGLSGRLTRGDLADPPIRPASADLVVTSLALGHVPQAAAAVRALAAALRPGGTLLFSDFHPDAYRRGWRRTFQSGGRTFEVQSYAYKFKELLDAAGETGLVLRDVLEPGFDERQREIFRNARKEAVFESIRGLPALLMARWSRPCT